MNDHAPAILDLRGHDSPVLALLALRALAALGPGQALELWLTSPQWARDLPCIVERLGGRCLARDDLPGGWRLVVARGGRYPERLA